MNFPKCNKCKRQFKEGDEVYEDETKKIDISGEKAEIQIVRLYTCYPKCEGK